MSQLFLLFSHKLTPAQEADARHSLGIQQIHYLPDDLQSIWSQVPPGQLDLAAYARPFCDFLVQQAQAQDYVLIQGDFGLSFYMVQFCFRQQLVPVYATTHRKVQEITQPDGKVIKQLEFEHQMFRPYST